MKKILITGFEPFGKHKYNPSQIILGSNYEPSLDDIEFKKTVFNNNFDEFLPEYMALLNDYQPNYIINCGLDSKIYAMRIERVALNLGYDFINKPDEILPVNDNGKNALFSKTDVIELADYLCKQGIPSEPSFHAGIYSCNYILYNSLQWCKNKDSDAIFVHLPYTHEIAAKNVLEQGVLKPSLSKNLIEKGFTTIIQYYLSQNINET